MVLKKSVLQQVPEKVLYDFVREAENIIDLLLERMLPEEYAMVVEEISCMPRDEMMIGAIEYVKAKYSAEKVYAETIFSSGELDFLLEL